MQLHLLLQHCSSWKVWAASCRLNPTALWPSFSLPLCLQVEVHWTQLCIHTWVTWKCGAPLISREQDPVHKCFLRYPSTDCSVTTFYKVPRKVLQRSSNSLPQQGPTSNRILALTPSSLVHSRPLSAPWGHMTNKSFVWGSAFGETQAKILCFFICHEKNCCLTQDALGYLQAKLYASENILFLNSSLQSTWMKNMFIHRISRTKFICGPSRSIPHCLHSLGVDIFYCPSDLSDSPSSRHRQCQPCSISASSWIRPPASPLHMKPDVAINWVLISPSNI